MKDTDRYKLLGTYSTPQVRIGDVLTCEARDCDVVVVAISNARIPWPIGRVKGTSHRSLIVYGDLLEAVKRESNQAVCYWLIGVRQQLVSKWRKAIGVGPFNEGSARLHDEVMSDPDRNDAIATKMTGKKRPAKLMKAIHKANRGRQHTEESRRKMSEAHRQRERRGRLDLEPWTAAEDELLRTFHPAEVVKRTGRKLSAVYSRRHLLGLNDGRTARHR